MQIRKLWNSTIIFINLHSLFFNQRVSGKCTFQIICLNVKSYLYFTTSLAFQRNIWKLLRNTTFISHIYILPPGLKYSWKNSKAQQIRWKFAFSRDSNIRIFQEAYLLWHLKCNLSKCNIQIEKIKTFKIQLDLRLFCLVYSFEILFIICFNL